MARFAAEWQRFEWMAPCFPIPDEATLPRLMSGPHPAAVGSYGPAAITAIEARRAGDKLVGARARALRWFQRLVLCRQLEHDADGRLVWQEVDTTLSRQMGKSVLLSERSWWRTERGGALFAEPQLALLVSKDLAAAREVQRSIRVWAGEVEQARVDEVRAVSPRGVLPRGYRPLYVVRGTHGQEEIETADGSRFMIRGRDSVYSYSVGHAEVDEAWRILPRVVDDGIEPTMAERECPQLCLTSTAHPEATRLMPGRLAVAEAQLHAPGAALLLLWGAEWGWDFDDPAVWRSASPHWDARRERVLRARWERWVTGAEDAEDGADEGEASGGFLAQWLNLWPRRASGPTWIDPDVWAAAGRGGVVMPAPRRCVGVSYDRVAGCWPVVAAVRAPDGPVVVGVEGVAARREDAVALASRAAAGGGGVLLIPRQLRGHVRVPGMRQTIQLVESDVSAALEVCGFQVVDGQVVHDPADEVLSAAVTRIPRAREHGRWDAGVLAVCAAWWAGREQDRSRVA